MMHRGAPGRQAPPTPVLTLLLAVAAVLLAGCSGSSPLIPTVTPESTGLSAPTSSAPSISNVTQRQILLSATRPAIVVTTPH